MYIIPMPNQTAPTETENRFSTNTDRLIPKAEERSKFWQNAHTYFDRVYQHMNLDPLWRVVLSSPKRVLTVSCPIKMDNGSIQVFTGYRAQHNNARGPFKGDEQDGMWVRYGPEGKGIARSVYSKGMLRSGSAIQSGPTTVPANP